jgi:hypothetical protein
MVDRPKLLLSTIGLFVVGMTIGLLVLYIVDSFCK